MALTVNELFYVDELLYARLNGDATLTGASLLNGTERIWADIIPEGQPYPGVVYSFQSGVDVTSTNQVRYVTRPLYIIKAVMTGDSYKLAAQIADRVDALLMGFSGTSGPVSIGKIYREQPIRIPEVKDGVSYRSVGGLYRFFVS